MADIAFSNLPNEITEPQAGDKLGIDDLAGGETKKMAYELVFGGNIYIPDRSETDQGVTGNGKTIKAYVDAIGSDKATIYLRHCSGGATTTYTLTTSETIPTNITLVREHGVIIDGAGTLTINGPFRSGLDQAFGSSITVTVSGLVEKVYSEWWGAVADGTTACLTAIQAAIDARGSGGGIVQLLEGTYLINGILKVDDNIMLQGIGYQSIIKLANTSNTNMIEVKSASAYADTNNVTIKDLQIDGNKANQTSNGIGMKLRLIDSKVDNVFVKDMFLQGIIFLAGHRNVCSNCIVTNVGNDGIITSLEYDTVISHCQAYSIPAGNGFLAYDGSYNIIMDSCVARNCAYCGFGVEYAASWGAVKDVIISNCQSISNDWSGFTVYKSFNVTIAGCVARLNEQFGIFIDQSNNVAISNNIIGDNSQDTHNTYDAIRLYGVSGFECYGCVVQGNIIDPQTATKEKYAVLEINNAYIDNNIITNNYIGSMGTGPISIAGDNTRVMDNIGADETVTTASPTLVPYGYTKLDSSSNAISATLGSGQYIGQIKTIVMTNATNSSTVSITNHQTSDPEVATFDAVDETGIFMWTGTEWITMYATCTFV